MAALVLAASWSPSANAADGSESDLPPWMRIGGRFGVVAPAGRVYRGGARAAGDSQTTPLEADPTAMSETGFGWSLEADVRIRIDSRWAVYLLGGHVTWSRGEGDTMGVGARWAALMRPRFVWALDASVAYETLELASDTIAVADGFPMRPAPTGVTYTGPSLRLAAGPSWKVRRWLDLDVLASLSAGAYLGCSANINPFVPVQPTSGRLACGALSDETIDRALHGSFGVVVAAWLR